MYIIKFKLLDNLGRKDKLFNDCFKSFIFRANLLPFFVESKFLNWIRKFCITKDDQKLMTAKQKEKISECKSINSIK